MTNDSEFRVERLVIPPITDPLGRYWDQPNRENILIDKDNAMMTDGEFCQLANYELTNPTGTYIGKMWRAGNTLRWYDRIEDTPNMGKVILIETREILVV